MNFSPDDAEKFRRIIDHLLDGDKPLDRIDIFFRLLAWTHIAGAISEAELNRQLRIIGSSRPAFDREVANQRTLFWSSQGVVPPPDPSRN